MSRRELQFLFLTSPAEQCTHRRGEGKFSVKSKKRSRRVQTRSDWLHFHPMVDVPPHDNLTPLSSVFRCSNGIRMQSGASTRLKESEAGLTWSHGGGGWGRHGDGDSHTAAAAAVLTAAAAPTAAAAFGDTESLAMVSLMRRAATSASAGVPRVTVTHSRPKASAHTCSTESSK